MNIIFLDVDGVLNEAYSQSRAPNGCIGVDDDKVKRLKKIVDATGAKIVLCSTWKMGWSRDPELCDNDAAYLNKKLAREHLRIRDKTEDKITDRGHGIINWLAKCAGQHKWIVLDDDIFKDYKECGIMPHLVKTSFALGGLQDEHVEKAIDLLMGA